MKTVIVLVAVLWGMILTAGPALAQGCSSQTIMFPDGRVMVCQTCGTVTTCF